MSTALYGDGLPYEVCGQKVRTDWRIMADFEAGIYRMKEGGEEAFAQKSLAAFYITRPADIKAALNGLLWFYRCGKPHEKSIVSGRDNKAIPYDFYADADLIFAAFRQTYSIDLGCEKMHWWRFRALMNSLPEDCKFCKVEGYRTTDTGNMSDAMRDFYEKAKKHYALPPEIGGLYAKPITKEEAEAAFIARLRRD